MDIDAIIETLGGTEAVQALLGVGASAVCNYRSRGVFPKYARPKIWQALTAKGIATHPETLALMPARLTTTTESKSKSGFESALESNGVARPKILLIITGGIAAYKALELIRRMVEKNWIVEVILTHGGAEFITPLSVSALSGKKAWTDLFSLTDEAEMGHIRLARNADAIIIAPASADFIAKIAHGLADDLASTVMLATTAPCLIAPAMNPFMWAAAATQANCAMLRSRGVGFIGPDTGVMACGEDGYGRLAETDAILEATESLLPNGGWLSGHTALVTSGPTHEPIDAVRYIANHASGKQGHAIAASLAQAGADVTLITGPVSEPPPRGVNVVAVNTAQEMLTASLAALPCSIAVCAAAVGDWRVDTPQNTKIKKSLRLRGVTPKGLTPKGLSPLRLSLSQNPDILATISQHKHRPRLVVGFAAETENLLANARAKRLNKGCDWLLANDVSGGQVFGQEDTAIHCITDGGSAFWGKMAKTAVAGRLTQMIIEALHNG